MAALRKGLGLRLKQLREAAGLTQEKLASMAKVDAKYLGAIERGEKSVSLEMLEKLILTLKVEPYEPFLFSLSARRRPEKIDEEALLNMIRHSDRSARPLLIHLVESILQWSRRRKST